MAITTFYVVKGGMFSVVITEVIQYGILTIASVAVGIIAIKQISPDALNAVIPEGWKSLWFGRTTGLDWTLSLRPPRRNCIRSTNGSRRTVMSCSDSSLS